MIKKTLCLLALAAVLPACQPSDPVAAAWKQAADIERHMRQPEFPDRWLDIRDFGAVADSATLCHEAINRAITECSLLGGGHVVVPAGHFLTGSITLKSHVDLHLQEGAVLDFASDRSLYQPAVLTRWEGVDCYNTHPFIYAYGETDLGLTGKGIIDAHGQDGWWSMCGARKYGWEEGLPGQNLGGRARLLRSAEDRLPTDRRIMTPEDALRPQTVNLYKCRSILIEDVTLLNSPFWVLHPLMCEDLWVRGVTVSNRGPNGDGCDPESCRNVVIENCRFDTGDDCIAIKSGRNNDGRRWAIPSENIIVRRCNMANGHGGVVIGSEISGGFRNLFVEDCVMDSPELERVIRIKTNTCRGGKIENIFVRRVRVGQCREAVLKINLHYEAREDCARDFPPTVRNVHMQDVTCQKSRYGVLVMGLEGMDNVSDIRVSDCFFDNVERGNRVEFASDVVFDHLHVNGELTPAPEGI